MKNTLMWICGYGENNQPLVELVVISKRSKPTKYKYSRIEFISGNKMDVLVFIYKGRGLL